MRLKIYYKTIDGFDFVILEQIGHPTLFEALGVAFCEVLEIEKGEHKIEISWDDENLAFCYLDLCQIYTVGFGDKWLNLFVPTLLEKYKKYLI